jgi:aspartyl-tRNA(Asn)/glutamyl-tRNA(Gln) amidotransferase subunit A
MEESGARIRRIATPVFAGMVEIGVPIVRWEALQYHRRWFPERRAEYGPDVARSLDAALELTRRDYDAAIAARRAIQRKARKLLETVDVLAGPTVPVTAFPNRVAYEPVAPGGELPRFALTRLTYPYSLSRLPSISIPCGLSSRRLPIGIQLAAGPCGEAQLLGAAAGYEAARGPMPRPTVSMVAD